MKVLVDTTIWSFALRRRSDSLNATELMLVEEWRALVRKARVGIIGSIRQEVLSGIRTRAQFALLSARLDAFGTTAVEEPDYDTAAEFFNKCRASGVVGTSVDMLICAVAYRLGWPIFTADADFARYGRHLPIGLHAPAPTRVA